ncbi:MAG TPA: GTPase, partial [Micavibrio sp.]
NAGKSTFLSACTRARPKIADYPFTTLHPNLGVAYIGEKEFIIADIPGLIEGASEGMGLGTRFLGHIERTAILLHLIDCTQDDIVEAYHTIRGELEAYGEGLAEKPELVALNKCDALGPELAADQARILEEAIGKKVHMISAISGMGVKDVLYPMWNEVKIMRDQRAAEAAARKKSTGYQEPVDDHRDEDDDADNDAVEMEG